MAAARTLFMNLSTRGKVALVGAAVGVLLLSFFMLRLASQPSYATLMTGLDPADTGEVTAALDEKGIGYELQNGGTALAVEESRTDEARVALAEQGLPNSGQPGFELFDERRLGQSDFEQQVAYERALEGEIARTLEQVNGVSGAQVDLVLPEEDLFADTQSEAKAAVLLSGRGTVEPNAVRGMAQLVASSVRGLKLENVTITDGSGQLVWPTEGGATGNAATARQAAEQRYEQELESNLNALLNQTLGPGRSQIQVQADVNVDEGTRDRLTYRRGVPNRRRTETEELEGGAAGGGHAGAAGNIPGYAAGAGGNESRYERESEDTEFGNNRTVERTRLAPGRVEGLDVALVLDQSVAPSDVDEIRRAVESAAGIDEERGDQLQVSQVPFARPEQPEEPGAVPGLLKYAKYAALGLALLAFLIFLARHLRRRENEALGADPVWLREIESPRPLAELERAEDTRVLPQPRNDEAEEARRHVEEVAAREPEKMAQQVRAWMRDDEQ